MKVVAGRVARAHGLRGEVTVEVRTDDPEKRFASGCVLGTDPAQVGPLEVVQARWHSGRMLVTFAGVASRDAADALRGTLLVVDTDDDEPLLHPDEFLDHELVGLAVFTVGGDQVGAVADVLHLPGQDVLSVRTPSGAEVLVPFVSAIVPEVDVAGGRVVLDPPPGLLDLDRAE
ncbi:MAG: ribosome maturation factor RimM [Actinomycetes bacterium]